MAVKRITKHRTTRTTGTKAGKAREFVVKYIIQHGRGPTYTEIQKATSVGDTTQVFKKLADDGVITYQTGDYTTARLCTGKVEEGQGVVVRLPPAVLEEVRARLTAQRAELDEQIASVDAALRGARAKAG